MRRLIIGCSAAALLLAGGVLASSVAVQATTPPTEEPAEGPPIVGSWVLRVDGFPEAFTELVAVQSDGTLIDTNAAGSIGIGSWEATGPNSFNLTFNSLSLIGSTDRVEGSLAMGTIRASGEVSEDGQSFTAEFTLELTGEGTPPGEFGLGSVTGNAYHRRADGHAGRSRGSPLPRPVPPPTRAPRPLAPNRWGPRQRAPNRQAPNRPGPRRSIPRAGNDGLDVAPGSTAGEPLDGTRLAPQCWTRREPQYPVCAWGGDAVPGAGRGQTAIVHASRNGPRPAGGAVTCRRDHLP